MKSVPIQKKYLLIFLLFFVFTLSAQTKRPKIGLTLSGGGAKGLSHIGILKALDSAGLKVDYITGTSMGSVVGALYATGYSGEQIEKHARSLDWKLLFSTSPKLSSIRIEEKSEYDKYALEMPFVKKKFKIGKGIIEGQELWLKLSELFEPVYNITNFSKLSIPFICIGTDMETGNSVQMDHGNIVTAIRASMAIPSVFTPVKYDNKLLVDGGVVNNFPVQDIKQMGADYVIGVNVTHGLKKSENLESALDILVQIGFFKSAAEFQKNKDACDLYIMPPLTGYSSGSFDASDSIIDIGNRTGEVYYPYFKKLSDSLNHIYGETDFKKERLPKTNVLKISKYSIEGLKNTEAKFFFGLLDLKDSINYSKKEMNEAIHRVYGSRYYKIVRYDFIPDTNGGTEMHFDVEENPLTTAKLAIHYNDFTKLALKVNLTSRDLIFKESRALLTVAVSENPRLYAEYYKFINKNRTSKLLLDYYYEAVDFPLYKDFRLYQTLRSIYNVFDVQLQKNINNSAYISIGQQYVGSKIRTEEAPSLIYNGKNNFYYTYMAIGLNNVNHKYFPTSGWYTLGEVGYTYSQNAKFEASYGDSIVNSDTINFNAGNYLKIHININHYSELNKRFALIKNLTFAYMHIDNPYIPNNFVVGGNTQVVRNQVTFSGLSESEIKTGSILAAKLGLQYQMAKKVFLTGRVNFALYDFYGKNLDQLSTKKNFLSGYGLTLGYNSPIGPMEFTVMYSDQDAKLRTNINIGYAF